MLWEHYREMLELAAIEHPAETPENMAELRARVRRGDALLMGIYEGGVEAPVAAAVVEIVETRDGRTLHVRYLAGEGMGQWLDELHARLEEVARGYDCRWISLVGRMGWRRELRRFDFNPVAIHLRAEVAA